MQSGGIKKHASFFWCSLALLGGILFLILGSYPTYPRLGAPLDDTFIHLQYARQLGDLQPYQYQDGAPASSGATSWLYLHLLGAFSFLGLDGDALLGCALLIGLLSWIAVCGFTFRLALRWTCRPYAYWVTAAVATSGALLWAMASGMEVILTSALLLAAVLAYSLWSESPSIRRQYGLIGSLCLLALVRPEGGYAAMVILGAAVYNLFIRRNRAETINKRYLALWLLPVAAFLWPYMATLLSTGHLTNNGLAAKSELQNPELNGMFDILGAFIKNGSELLAFLNGANSGYSGWVEFTPPGFLVLLVGFGILAAVGGIRSIREKMTLNGKDNRIAFSSQAVAVFVVLVWCASVATLSYWSLHNYRYVLPLFPLLYALLAGFVFHAETRFAESSHAIRFRRFAIVLGLAAVTLHLSGLPRWGARLSEQSESIRSKQGLVAAWLDRNTPQPARIGINDAGLIAYESNRSIYDLVGLMETPEAARIYRLGDGAIYEYLSAMPDESRPDYFAVFPHWFKSLALFDVLGEPVLEFADPFFPEMEKVIYRPTWASIQQGLAPRLSALPDGSWNTIDELDVADPASENAHNYSSTFWSSGQAEDAFIFRRNFGYHEEIKALYPFQSDRDILEELRENGRLPEVDIIDAGRRHSGTERFTVNNIDPLKPMIMIIRTCDDRAEREYFHYSIQVCIDGKPLSDWSIRGRTWNWYERWYLIPATALSGETATVELKARPTQDVPWFVSGYYWFMQPSGNIQS